MIERKTVRTIFYFLQIFATLQYSCSDKPGGVGKSIDRFSLVTRHNVVLHEPDTLGSLSVGNGEFAFTVDVSGLQTFRKEYENGIPLGTQSQWAWHTIPTDQSYTLKDVARPYTSCDGSDAWYPVQHKDGRAGKATNALRANPHRLHLGLIGLKLLLENGEEVKLEDLKNIHQTLDLWTGKIESVYEIQNVPVRVTLFCHQEEDKIAVRIESPLIPQERLAVKFNFPYGAECHVCPGYDWERLERHRSLITSSVSRTAIKRMLDTTIYHVHISHPLAKFSETVDPHNFELVPQNDREVFEFTVLFNQDSVATPSNFDQVEENSTSRWQNFWNSGGAIDFSECTDPRAKELERRVVLSQYLTRIQSAGSLPPQETGLTMNSWYGKFHLEMHWWHAAHFALWNRIRELEKSMKWYDDVLKKAKETATRQGYAGARWQKMTDPFGNESPSDVGAFIIWQQPHPIYFAELLYRSKPDRETLDKYKTIVLETADFMASFVKEKDGTYHLCHPLIPAQEIFRATETDNPAYELQYWYYGLSMAQEWRIRLGLEENEKWKAILDNLATLPVKDHLYLPNQSTPRAYEDDQYRRDHPAVAGAFGFLPFNSRMDTVIMANTLREIMRRWQWDSTWGWDYPLLAMTASRLHQPELAIDALLMDVQKNTYLINGHNYQDKRLRLYLPGNGGLLAAVAMMAAGWDNNTVLAPGFPKDGKWNIKWEGLHPMP